jgi:hypothetical protein
MKGYIPELEKVLRRMPAEFSTDVDLQELPSETNA